VSYQPLNSDVEASIDVANPSCRDEARETIGVFMCKGTLRQEENSYLELPPDVAKARNFSPQLLRLLGYGICPPALGLHRYKDPMETIFNVIDEETVRK
jgi:hypothetical protein